MKNVLITRNLKKEYGSKGNIYPALNDINLGIAEGEFVGIMGPSGAGKTTLLNMISTIDKPTSGEVLINNEDVTKMDENSLSNFRMRTLGFLFQDFNLLDTLTLEENIVLPLALAGVTLKEIEARLNEVTRILGIQNLLHKYPYEVSGGQKQRAAASRAIITKPSLLLADEPTGALDSRASAELLQMLCELNENHKATIMMVTHDTFAASYCKRILFIKDGTLFSELVRGSSTRKDFFSKILDVLAAMDGHLSSMQL